MNNVIRTLVWIGMFLIAGVVNAAAAQADYYLKIEGVAGEFVAKIDPAGNFSVRDLPMGTYQVSIVVIGDVDGDAAVEQAVKSPRDAATGLATGKRQHKPMTFKIEMKDVVISNISTSPTQVSEAEGSVTLAPAGSPAPRAGISTSRSNIRTRSGAASPNMLTIAGKSKEITGHVTLMK